MTCVIDGNTTNTKNKTMATPATTNKPANQWDEKEIGCLWRRETQTSKESYMTGVLKADKLRQLLASSNEDIQLVCFSNKQKKEDRHPDVRVYISEKKTAQTPRPTPVAAASPSPTLTSPLAGGALL